MTIHDLKNMLLHTTWVWIDKDGNHRSYTPNKKEKHMKIKTVNPLLGMSVEFDSLQDLEFALRHITWVDGDGNRKSYMPEDGLKEGRDFEYIV